MCHNRYLDWVKRGGIQFAALPKRHRTWYLLLRMESNSVALLEQCLASIYIYIHTCMQARNVVLSRQLTRRTSLWPLFSQHQYSGGVLGVCFSRGRWREGLEIKYVRKYMHGVWLTPTWTTHAVTLHISHIITSFTILCFLFMLTEYSLSLCLSVSLSRPLRKWLNVLKERKSKWNLLGSYHHHHYQFR